MPVYINHTYIFNKWPLRPICGADGDMLRGIFDSLVHENLIRERNQEHAAGQPTRQDGHGVRIPGRKNILVGGSSRVWVF